MHATCASARSKLGEQSLNGTIPSPSGWVLPPGLRRFWFWGHYLHSSIPAAWVLPHGPQEMWFMRNGVEGSLPQAWGASLPTTLWYLNLNQNGLTGECPVAVFSRLAGMCAAQGLHAATCHMPWAGFGPCCQPGPPCTPLSWPRLLPLLPQGPCPAGPTFPA